MKMIKRIIISLVLFLILPFTTIHASSDIYVEDSYGVLTSEEVQELQNYAKEVSDKYQFGVYARILEDPTEESYDDMDTYSEEFYTSQNLGYGDTQNGVLLIITFCDQGGSYQVMIPPESDMNMFTLDTMDEMDNAAYKNLKEHDYYNAIKDYIQKADFFMQYYQENGEAYGSNYGYEEEEHVPTNPFTSPVKTGCIIGIPALLSLIIILVLKSKNKTKYTASTAQDYIPKNGIHITNARDMFLYQSVTRTPLPKDDDVGGSSPGGSHFSSSGGMHSGGGHF